MLQKTYVVDTYDDGSRAEERSRILHMQKVGAVSPQPSGKIETKADKRVHGDALLQEPFGDIVKRFFPAKIGHEISLAIQRRKTIQEISYICLVPC
jgi:hypothetical protein